MKAVETLEAYLQQQKSAGVLDQPGVFTIDRERALQKIAGYQLPYKHAWLLKLCQAAVLMNSTRLSVDQIRTETVFNFNVLDWDSLNFESLFFDPAGSGGPGFDTLRQGLWAAGVGQLRPLQVQLPGDAHSYVWNGRELSQAPALGSGLQVRMSVRTVSQGKGFPLISSVQAAAYNWEVLNMLRECAYTLPIPLRVDNVAVSGYENSKTHGCGELLNPLRLIGLEAPWPALKSPQPVGGSRKYEQHKRLRPLSDLSQVGQPLSAPIVVLLTAHGGYHRAGKNSAWKTDNSPSFVFWVKSGVVIQKEQIDIGQRSVSVAVHLPAEHLRTDLTGFAVEEEQAAEMRRIAMKKVAAHLHTLDIDFMLRSRDWYKAWKSGSLALVVGGIGAKVLLGPVGIPFAVAGVVSGIHALQSVDAVCHTFERDFEKTKKLMSEKFCS